MCGIAGIIKKKNYDFDKFKIFKIMDTRGPDSKGHYKKQNKNYSINLFHSRLSIIDFKDRSNQPFSYKNLILIYNGEIYNFREIKGKLEKIGHKFKTKSDTEVLIKSYYEWGDECFKLFDGMWAVCIYDIKKNEIILSRDIFGEKPLYIFRNAETLVFGSEIKYLHCLEDNPAIKKINKQHINDYLKLGYKFLFKKNETYFQNVFKIDPGTTNHFCLKNFKLKKKRQIISKKFNRNIEISREDAVKKIRELIIKSIESRLISDRPLGFYLSGGIDTGTITSVSSKILNKKITCFSIIDEDKKYNEEKNIDATTKDLNCKTIKIRFPNRENFLDRLTSQIEYHDKPISSLNYYTHSFLHEEVKKHNIKVLLSGLGGDEMFTGYYDHFLMHLSELKKKDYPLNLSYWKKYIKPFIRNKNLKNLKLFNNRNNRKYLGTEFDKKFINKIFTDNSVQDFYEKKYSNSLLKNRMLNELFHELVPLINNEDDMNSMRMSIENRSPFLNKDILNFTMSLNSNLFIKNGYGKSLLRDAMKGVLNDQVRLDREKYGFNSSIHSLVNLKSNMVYDFLTKNKKLSEFINVNFFMNFIRGQKNFDNKDSKLIFSIFNVAIFLEKYY